MVRSGPIGPQFTRSVGTLVCRQLVNIHEHDIFFTSQEGRLIASQIKSAYKMFLFMKYSFVLPKV